MREISPDQFILSAYTEVNELTDEGDQMHRRGVRGKPLIIHVHGWDAWCRPGPMRGGVQELQGGCRVSLRVQGQYVDYATEILPSFERAREFAAAVTALLATMPPPIPGEVYQKPVRQQQNH